MSTHFFAAFPCPIQAQPILMKMFMLQSIIRWHLYDHAGKLLYIFFMCHSLQLGLFDADARGFDPCRKRSWQT